VGQARRSSAAARNEIFFVLRRAGARRHRLVGVEEPVTYPAGYVAFEAADDFLAAFAFLPASGDLGFGAGVAHHSDEGTVVDGFVGLAVAAAAEPVPGGLPGGRGDWCHVQKSSAHAPAELRGSADECEHESFRSPLHGNAFRLIVACTIRHFSTADGTKQQQLLRRSPVASAGFERPVYPPVTGQFRGRVLRESGGRGNPAIMIRKFWAAHAPVGDRLTGGSGRTEDIANSAR
jgi:hypothetical protein